ncbi:uncharacterized protein LOC143892027 [Tasmannia lanceolata]|uniref:uncharacterized protein LOC143892027 n=1 Tax=Tasmannia lanceolata TaxID=3420 RepID=UPI0040629C47
MENRKPMDFQLLEINLISAQNLKPITTNLRRMHTYAVAWVDPTKKLRTRIDHVGGEFPTWNDKFIFRVGHHFLSGENSAVCIEIYAVGYVKDTLIGTVRFLINGHISSGGPSFSAVQIRRPSGRFHGVLNLGATMISGSLHVSFPDNKAIGYRDLMGGKIKTRRRQPIGKNGENSGEDSSGEYSGGRQEDSDASSALKNWNGMREVLGGSRTLNLCGLGFQRKIHLSPSDQNLDSFSPSDDIKNSL